MIRNSVGVMKNDGFLPPIEDEESTTGNPALLEKGDALSELLLFKKVD